MTIFDKGIMIWVAWCKPYDTNDIKPISNSQQSTKMLEVLALATRTNSFKSSCIIIRCVLQCVIITVRLCGFEGVLHAQVRYSCHCVPMFHILIVFIKNDLWLVFLHCGTSYFTPFMLLDGPVHLVVFACKPNDELVRTLTTLKESTLLRS